jgi:hypothetical protein
MAEAGARLLVAEDNKVNRLLLARNLQLQGHTVASADNGRLALEMLRKDRYDLLLLDITMPEMDGFQVLEQAHGGRSLFARAGIGARTWAGLRRAATAAPRCAGFAVLLGPRGLANNSASPGRAAAQPTQEPDLGHDSLDGSPFGDPQPARPCAARRRTRSPAQAGPGPWRQGGVPASGPPADARGGGGARRRRDDSRSPPMLERVAGVEASAGGAPRSRPWSMDRSRRVPPSTRCTRGSTPAAGRQRRHRRPGH